MLRSSRSIAYLLMVKNKEFWLTMLYISISVVNLGYLLMSLANSVEFAVLSFVIIASSPMIPLYCKSVEIVMIDGTAKLVKEYGPLHNAYLVYLLAYFFAMISKKVLENKRRKDIAEELCLSENTIKTYTCSLCSHVYTEQLPKRINEVTNQESDVSLTVPSISNAYIPDGTVFEVVEQPVEQVPEQVLGEIAVTAEGAAKPLGMYDLSLLLDGAKIQPNGTVAITLPAPDLEAEYDRIIVVFIAHDGSYEECATTINEDGTITFETDHFSQYAIIGITEAANDGGLGTGAIIGIIAGVIALLCGGFCLYWFVIKKKQNA